MENSKFYLIVDGIFNIIGKGIVVTGCVQGDYINVGDELVINSKYFENKTCKALQIETFRKKLKCAYPGDNVGITLSNIQKADVHKKDTIRKMNYE